MKQLLFFVYMVGLLLAGSTHLKATSSSHKGAGIGPSQNERSAFVPLIIQQSTITQNNEAVKNGTIICEEVEDDTEGAVKKCKSFTSTDTNNFPLITLQYQHSTPKPTRFLQPANTPRYLLLRSLRI